VSAKTETETAATAVQIQPFPLPGVALMSVPTNKEKPWAKAKLASSNWARTATPAKPWPSK